jgi:hypothetical protein
LTETASAAEPHVAAEATAAREPGEGGPQPAWRRRLPDVLGVAIVLAAVALPLRGLLRYQGPPMEEGFMLVFPEQVLHGALPNRDFLHLYGTGSLWVLAGVYKVFGTSLATERWFGLVQNLGIVFGVYAIARAWGRKLAVVGALVALIIILPPMGLAAMAWNGALALGVWTVWTGLRVHRRPQDPPAPPLVDDPRTRRLLVTAGVLGGFTLLYRPDFIVAVCLALVGIVWGLGARRWRQAALGLVIGLSPYVIQIATAGPGHSFDGMVLDPVFRLRGGRSLPVPPSWDHLSGYLQGAAGLRKVGWPFPQPGDPQQVFMWFFIVPLAALLIVGAGWWSLHRRPGGFRGRVLLVAGLFNLGLVTQGLQRPDTTHFAWASCVSLALVPVAVAELLSIGSPRLPRLARSVAGIAVVAVVLCCAMPQFTVRTYVDVTGQSFGRNTFGTSVNRNGRNFYYGTPAAADAANALIAAFDAQHPRPGQRLFVGTVDLRRTPYDDAFFYFLYPELSPATYYIEMDPFDSRLGSRLAGDVRSADWLILSNLWRNWDEPNDSSKYGSNAPNEVVQRDFCLVGKYGQNDDGTPIFELYRQCRS